MLAQLRTFFVIVLTTFALPAIAAEQECDYEPTSPDAVFVEAVKTQHPGLDDSSTTTIARMYELAYRQNILANDDTATESAKSFAGRAEQIAMKTAGLQHFVLDTVPEMESVLEKMRIEEASGLEWVSDELKPEVRATGRKMVVVGLTWGELSNETGQLIVDHVSAIADQGGNVPDMLAEIERAMCVLKSTVDGMSHVAEFFPTGVAFTAVEDFRY